MTEQQVRVLRVDMFPVFRFRYGLKVSLGLGWLVLQFTLLKYCFSSDKFWYCDDCDQVSADARKFNSTSPFFDTLDMTCPDGEMETIDISRDKIYETNAISAQLPAYCRKHCDDVFKASN